MSEYLHRLSVVSVVITLLFSIIIVLPTSITSQQISVDEDLEGPKNITQNSSWQMSSSVWGDKIVWEDYRNDEYGTTASGGNRNADIYLYNMTSNETVQLTTNDSDQRKPDIWKNYVVWEDYRNGEADIYYLDLTSSNLDPKRVTNDKNSQIRPRIHSGKIVWEDYRNHDFGDIYLYDIEKDEMQKITDERVIQENPDIYGNKIVWDDYRNYWFGEYKNQSKDIFMYDISTENETGIVEEEIHQHHPSIYENRVVWVENVGKNNNDIYMKTIGENKRKVTDMPSIVENPSIYGSRVVFNERKYESGDHISDTLWMYDHINDNLKKLSEIEQGTDDISGIVRVRSAQIHQNTIVWEECHPSKNEDLSYQYDIFYATTGTKSPSVLSTQIETKYTSAESETNMTLKEGNYVKITVDVVDPDGDLRSVYLDAGELPLQRDTYELTKDSSGDHTFKFVYNNNMTAGTKNIPVKAVDSQDNEVNVNFEVEFEENAPVIHDYGIGSDPDNLTKASDFYLREGGSIHFWANVTDPDKDLSTVHLDLSDFDLENSRALMEENVTSTGWYEYTLTYNEEMTAGDKTPFIFAVDERENSAESGLLDINAVAKGTVIGKVEDQEGESMVGATVSFDSDINITTDEAGEFQIELQGGMKDVKISKEEYENHTSSIEVVPGETHDLGTITLTEVKDGEDGDEGLPLIFFISLILIFIVVALSIIFWKRPELLPFTSGETEE